MNRTARLLAILLVTVIVGVGIYVAYRTGFDNGAVAAAATGDNSGAGTVVVPVDAYRGPYGWHGGFFFFPFFPILFLLLLFGVFRPWRGGGGPGRGWNGGGRWGGPSPEMMERHMSEWHKQAHNEGDANRSGS
jgi:hypothetical protein